MEIFVILTFYSPIITTFSSRILLPISPLTYCKILSKGFRSLDCTMHHQLRDVTFRYRSCQVGIKLDPINYSRRGCLEMRGIIKVLAVKAQRRAKRILSSKIVTLSLIWMLWREWISFLWVLLYWKYSMMETRHWAMNNLWRVKNRD